MELDKYLTEETAEDVAKRNIAKRTAELQRDLKKLTSLMKKNDFDKAMTLYNTEIAFKTRSLDTYLRILSKRV